MSERSDKKDKGKDAKNDRETQEKKTSERIAKDVAKRMIGLGGGAAGPAVREFLKSTPTASDKEMEQLERDRQLQDLSSANEAKKEQLKAKEVPAAAAKDKGKAKGKSKSSGNSADRGGRDFSKDVSRGERHAGGPTKDVSGIA